MKLSMLALCALMTLCGAAARADNPGLGAYDAPADTAGAPAGADDARCRAACYDRPQGCPKKAACAAYEQANPGYFSGLDSSCGLPAGTAVTMAGIESSCSNGATGATGTYVGMFAFSSRSCPNSNLRSPTAQGTCLCSSMASWRSQFQRATGGQSPSAGMYYLMHQQGGCGVALSLGGSRRAIDVVYQCVPKSGMGYATAAIKGNIPVIGGRPIYDYRTVTADQFAHIYLDKFKHIDGGSTASGCQAAVAEAPTTPATTPAGPTLAPQEMLAAVAASRGLTLNGQQLTEAFIQAVLSDKIGELFSPLTNPKYEDEEDDDSDSAPQVDIDTHSDGTKTVKVTQGRSTVTFDVNHGQQLWNCNGTYDVVDASNVGDKVDDGCTLVTSVAEAPAN